MWWTLCRSCPLRLAHIAESGRSNFTGTPVLAGGPLNDIVRVLSVMDKRAPLAFGFPSSAYVVHDDGVAAFLLKTRFVEEEDLSALVVGGRLDNSRCWQLCLPR